MNSASEITGYGMDFKNIFSAITGKVNSTSGVEKINQSLSFLFNCNPREIPILAVLGSGLDYLVFEPNDVVLSDMIKLYTNRVINRFEPRIRVNSIDTVPYESETHVKVHYTITDTNQAGVFDYTITKETGGDVL